MTFGETGETLQTENTSYSFRGKGVGHFESNRLLERMLPIDTYSWAKTTASNTKLFDIDVDLFLRQATRNWEVLRQFHYYRAEEIEITVRLNTNQFYIGSLLVAMHPLKSTGDFIDECAVLDPTVISASTAQAVIKTYKYTFPNAWLRTTQTDSNPVMLRGWILNKLEVTSPSAPPTIDVLVWARFKNIQLSYPCQAQSSRGRFQIKSPSGNKTNHPSDDPGTGPVSLGSLVDAVVSEPIAEVVGGVAKVISAATPLLALLDKPDFTENQTPVIVEGSSDYFAADVPDTNVFVGIRKQKYVDPAPSRLPMTKPWSASDYARIPGLLSSYPFDQDNTVNVLNLTPATRSATDLRTPFDYTRLNFRQWRGSIKLFLQFFTSSFVSARFALQVRNIYDGTFATDYSDGLSRIIDVKGDTMNTVTIPWLSTEWWNDTYLSPIETQLQLISSVVSNDSSTSPTIYCNYWVAAGEDVQFAWPQIPDVNRWPYRAPPSMLSDEKEKEKPEIWKPKTSLGLSRPQCSIGKIFATSFPPIVEDCDFQADYGNATNEAVGLLSDVCKRYSILYTNLHFDGSTFVGDGIDWYAAVPAASNLYGSWYASRFTFFGMWRAAFLYRSGGYRYRRYPNTSEYWQIKDVTDTDSYGNYYQEPYDQIRRVTVPQVMHQPFGELGQVSNMLSVVTETESNKPVFVLAARDDQQFGYPILPAGFPLEPIA